MARARINIRPRNPKLPLFRFLEWLAVVVSVVLVLVLILFVMMTPVVIQDKSVNELDRGDLVFADRFGKFISPYGRGDLIVYKCERFDTAKQVSKTVATVGRVIAFGGEEGLVTGGRVYINGSLLDEKDYAAEFPEDMYLSFTVLENKLLLLPDERSEIHSLEIDDITFEYGDVIGEVRFRVYPFGGRGIYI